MKLTKEDRQWIMTVTAIYTAIAAGVAGIAGILIPEIRSGWLTLGIAGTFIVCFCLAHFAAWISYLVLNAFYGGSG